MNNYESKYEEYKNTLLSETWFRKGLQDLYKGSIRVEKDYIDENGVLWKVGLLSAVCGFLIAFTPIESGNWVLGIFLFLGIMGSLIWARHIGEKFKKDSGELKFYVYRYNKYLDERIQEDKCRKVREFEECLSKTVAFMQRCANNPSNDPSEIIAEFQQSLRFTEDLEKQFKEFAEYDYYAIWLTNDYHFNAEMQKDIGK